MNKFQSQIILANGRTLAEEHNRLCEITGSDCRLPVPLPQRTTVQELEETMAAIRQSRRSRK